MTKKMGITTRVDTVALDALLSIAENIAYKRYEGKLTIFRSEDNWRAGFGMPENGYILHEGISLEDALTEAIIKEVVSGDK